MSSSSRLPRRFLLRVLLLLLLTAAVGLTYQAVENYIPYWDYARIEGLFNQLADAFDGGVVNGFSWLLHQVNRVEYNSVFALPLMVAADVVGESRDRIVLAVLLVHVALYLVAFGFLLRRVFGYRSLDEVGLLQLGSALLLPSVFTATLLGFETIAVLPVLTAGLTVFLAASWPDEPRTVRASLGLFFLAGALLASTFLIRRAYAYTVISFYFTAGLVLLGEVVFGRIAWWSREMWLRIAGFAVAGVGSLAMLLGVARDRVFAVLATPYHELYAAWKITPAEAARQLLSSVGGIVVLVATAGYVVRRSVLPHGRRVMAVLLGLAGAVGFLQWFFLVKLRMRLDKPMLYAPMIALGFALLFTGRSDRRWFNVARGSCLVLLLLNLAISLGAVPPIDAAKRVVFADPLPPLTRADMAEFRDLVGWLREHTADRRGRGEPILVLAASGDINDSLVKEAEHRFFGWGNDRLWVPPFNTVDRTSNYPVWLSRAEWVLVARPFQFHTSAEERRLLRFAWDEFDQGRGVAGNFARVDQTWVVGRNSRRKVRVEIWRRTKRDTPAEVLDMLDRAKAFVVHHPVFPDLWLPEDSSEFFRSTRIKRAGEHYDLAFGLGPERNAVNSAVLMQPLGPNAEIRADLTVLGGSAGRAVIVAELLDEESVRAGAERVLSREVVKIGGPRRARLEVKTPANGRTLLRLELARRSGKESKGGHLRVNADVRIVDHSR